VEIIHRNEPVNRIEIQFRLTSLYSMNHRQCSNRTKFLVRVFLSFTNWVTMNLCFRTARLYDYLLYTIYPHKLFHLIHSYTDSNLQSMFHYILVGESSLYFWIAFFYFSFFLQSHSFIIHPLPSPVSTTITPFVPPRTFPGRLVGRRF